MTRFNQLRKTCGRPGSGDLSTAPKTPRAALLAARGVPIGDCFVKIVVYAICKKKAGYAERWMASMAEADGVYVLDTGSTDGTAERLRALGAVVVEERVEPWRFDTARNRSFGAGTGGRGHLCVYRSG